jgi:hypothetical protein
MNVVAAGRRRNRFSVPGIGIETGMVYDILRRQSATLRAGGIPVCLERESGSAVVPERETDAGSEFPV